MSFKKRVLDIPKPFLRGYTKCYCRSLEILVQLDNLEILLHPKELSLETRYLKSLCFPYYRLGLLFGQSLTRLGWPLTVSTLRWA